MKREGRKMRKKRGEGEKSDDNSLNTIWFFRSSKAEDIEEFPIQQNEEVKAKATEEKAKEVVKDLQKTLQAPLTGE